MSTRAEKMAIVVGMFLLLVISSLVTTVTADRTEHYVIDCAHFSLLKPHPNGTVYDRFELAPSDGSVPVMQYYWLHEALLTRIILHADQWFASNYTLSNESLALRLRFSGYDISFDTENDSSLTPQDVFAFPFEDSQHVCGPEALLSIGPVKSIPSPIFVEVAVYQTWNLTYMGYNLGADNYFYEPSPLEILIMGVTLIPLTICAVWKKCRMRRNNRGNLILEDEP